MGLAGCHGIGCQLKHRITVDLRDFIRSLDQAGFLVRVNDSVDWRYEIGRISSGTNRPLLFQNIKGYPNHQVFTGGLLRIPFVALALGMAQDTPRAVVIRTLRERMQQPRTPVMVASGPVAERITVGREVDLHSLPAPWWNETDGGRYIGTWHANLTKDPETGERNAGVYRMQVIGANQTTVSVSPRSHLALQMQKAEQAQRPLEMAVAIGVAEPIVMAAGAAFPYGIDELAVAGGLMGQAVEMVNCRTIALDVPANSEIVLEGVIRPGVRVRDGPYVDYAGIPSVNPKAYLFEVSAITQRDKPIFRGAAVGRPGAEDHQVYALLADLGLVDFHGSRVRQTMQTALLRWRLYRLFQWTGRLGFLKPRWLRSSGR